MFNQFIEKKFKSHARRLNDREYAEVLDNIVIATTDFVVINPKGEMLLGKRSYYPAKGWWIIGGRLMPGESPQEAAARDIKRELKLIISPKRFSYLGTYSMAWIKRRQAPEKNGTHSMSTIMALFISNKEVADIKLNEEHKEMKWRRPELVEKDAKLVPALRQCAKDILSFLKQYGRKKTNRN